MEEKVKASIEVLEDSLQEIRILLKMSDTNLFSFTSYRTGKVDKPPHLKQWAEDSLIGEFEKMQKAIETLGIVRVEIRKLLK